MRYHIIIFTSPQTYLSAQVELAFISWCEDCLEMHTQSSHTIYNINTDSIYSASFPLFLLIYGMDEQIMGEVGNNIMKGNLRDLETVLGWKRFIPPRSLLSPNGKAEIQLQWFDKFCDAYDEFVTSFMTAIDESKKPLALTLARRMRWRWTSTYTNNRWMNEQLFWHWESCYTPYATENFEAFNILWKMLDIRSTSRFY